MFITGVLGLFAFAASVVGSILNAGGALGDVVRLAALAVAVLVVLGVIAVGRALRGTVTVLDELVEVASRVEAGDYSARVRRPVRGAAPVRGLVAAVDTMAARLEADEKQRRTLLADVTHELRTPLAVVQGNVEAILDGVHPPDAEHLEAILDETRILARLVDDLRTLALSEAGSLSLHREPTDLGILLADVATAFDAAAGSAGITIEADVDESVPLVELDPVRIREVLGNLVANALRHTPSGGRIELGGTAVANEAGTSSIRLRVADTGSGIEPELLPHVFDRFVRSKQSSGSGLGLAIARGLVELHGGSVRAASRAHGGTEITIDLPLRPAAEGG